MPHNWASPVCNLWFNSGEKILQVFEITALIGSEFVILNIFFGNVKYITLCIILHFLKSHKV